MHLKLGYTPTQEEVKMYISDALPYVTDVYCDFSNLYCKINNGHYAHPYTDIRRPIDGGGLGEFVGEKGLKQIEEFLKTKLNYPIKASWELFSHNGEKRGGKVIISLVEIEGKPKLTFKEFFIGQSASGNGEQDEIDLQQLETYYAMNKSGILSTYNDDLINDLKTACDYFNYDFEVFYILPTVAFSPLVRDHQNFFQLFVNKDISQLTYLYWQEEKVNSLSEYLIDLPMTADSFLAEIDHRPGQYNYAKILDLLKRHFNENEIIDSSPPGEASQNQEEEQGNTPFTRDDIHDVITKNTKPNSLFNPLPGETCNVFSYSFDHIDIDEDIHLFKQLGKKHTFGENQAFIFDNFSNNYIVIENIGKEKENLFIFKNGLYLTNSNFDGKEIKNFPNAIINAKYEINYVYESKTKLLIECNLRGLKTIHLFLLDKKSGRIESRKF